MLEFRWELAESRVFSGNGDQGEGGMSWFERVEEGDPIKI